MAKSQRIQPLADSAAAESPLSIDELTDRAIAKFAAKSRDEYPREEVRQIVAGLDLAKVRSTRKVPRLLLRRLKFTGTKTLGDVDSPINYDQTFKPGVNALIIEDNLVGKSSVLKTIKFALTGSDDEYDQEVRRWIKDIWLQFSLDEKPYTILLARREDGLHARLVPGDHECQIEVVPKAATSLGVYRRGDAEVQQALDSFFVQEFGLATLGWNRVNTSGDGGSLMVWAKWTTYFQALRIPDDDHTYLLCKPEYANQDLVLFSAFLGLHLSEPLNQLSMDSAALRKQKAHTDEQAAELTKKKDELSRKRAGLRQQLSELDAEQARRLLVVTGGNLAQQLVEAQGRFAETSAEANAIEEQASTLSTQAQQATATARRLREQIDLSRLLTGLDVTICPNCAQGIEAVAVQREKDSHQCRLCVRPVVAANQDEEAVLEASAKKFDEQAAELRTRVADLNRELAAARKRAEGELSLTETLQQTIKEGVTRGLPTPEENEQRGKLHEEIGGINQEITSIERALSGGTGEVQERKAKIIEKVQLVLKEEADQRNREIENRLNELAQEVIKALRADQITGIKCYATGSVKLTKHGELVSFSGIKNPGERYRAKLALFLAMMRLGCEAGVGRHPGLLLLDQLGTAELVTSDLQASAAALRRIEEEFANSVQIICFTTKAEFRAATVPDKVYGHSVVGTDGKKYAF